jgi:hypothetical protein
MRMSKAQRSRAAAIRELIRRAEADGTLPDGIISREILPPRPPAARSVRARMEAVRTGGQR